MLIALSETIADIGYDAKKPNPRNIRIKYEAG